MPGVPRDHGAGITVSILIVLCKRSRGMGAALILLLRDCLAATMGFTE